MNADTWLDLLNSDWHDPLGSGRHEDRLEDPRWLEGFISRSNLDLRGVPRRLLVPALRRLRETMRSIVDRIVAGKKSRTGDWSGLSAYLENVPFIRKVRANETGLELVEISVSDKLEVCLASLARSFVETIAQGDISRLKVCRNKDCRWVYLDASRNRSRRWCETTCGNLMKVRRYRERQRKK